MSHHPDVRDQTYQFFIEEAPELLQALETGLLTLRENRSPAHLHDLMRAAHSLKGSAASVRLEVIKDFAHRLENILKALYNDTVEIDTDLETHLLQAYDCIWSPLMEQITVGGFDGEEAIATAEPVFAYLEARLEAALERVGDFLLSSTDLGVDMVASIVEVDVAQGLERLQQICDRPDQYMMVRELETQAEVFAGIAELLNLEGFGAIAQAVKQALEVRPDQALQITQLAIADFWAARAEVLAGQRGQAGRPSEALLALGTASEKHFADVAFDLDFDLDFDLSGEAPDLAAADPEDLGTEVIDADLLGFETALVQAMQQVDEEAETEVAHLLPEPPLAIATPPPEPEPTDLQLTLDGLRQAFDSLPTVDDLPLPPIPQSTTIDVVATPARALPIPPSTLTPALIPAPLSQPEAAQPAPALNVRVGLDRLERMNDQVGELAINRNRLSLQHEQLQQTARDLTCRFSRFQNLVEQLRDFSNKVLLAPVLQQRSPAVHSVSQAGRAIASTGWAANFDPLEMDQYSTLYAHLQEILEEVVPLEEGIEDVALFTGQSNQTLQQQRQMMNHLRHELMWARMLPLGEVLNRFPRVLRDLSIRYGKPVDLKLVGTGVLVDRVVLERLYDPLLHLLRNAFDHGIESLEERQQRGKAETGTIEIRAYHQGNKTLIEVWDDGQGLNLQRIYQRAVERQMIGEHQEISPNDLFHLIFEPGFSTASTVGEISGRGVGLDVVRSRLHALQGSITVHSQAGSGTTFTLCLPLTLTIAKLLVCSVGQTAIAIPSDGIEEIVVPKNHQVHQSGGQSFLTWRKQLVPMQPLSDLLNYGCRLPEATLGQILATAPMPRDWSLPLLVLRRDQQIIAFEVNRLVTEQELVIKPFGGAIAPPAYVYGCTILGDGTLIPVVDGHVLVEQLLASEPSTSEATRFTLAEADEKGREALPPIREQSLPVILVVDDAATLRRMVALTLQRSGYRATQARDGWEAVAQLEQLHIDLIICDIEMPNMNGFEFLNYRRQHGDLAQIPVVILTSRSNEKHRQLALHLGADAYFTKPYTEKAFLDAIARIMRVAQPLKQQALQAV
ncbi:MAG: hybrid sensor histidine kinase/response regulator [Synechococcales bacterium]|nr:hybrid sensor histidine kinase/response regulator [Synechococcales bacterium]